MARILIVEDEQHAREALGEVFDSAHDVDLAADVAEARAAIAIKPPDLVLTDVVLPGGMSGPEFVRVARRTRPDLKAAYMSGYFDDALERLGGIRDDAVLLHKPFEADELDRRLREALAEG